MNKTESMILEKLRQLGNGERGFLEIKPFAPGNSMYGDYIISIGKYNYIVGCFTEESLFGALVAIQSKIASAEKWYD